MTMGKIKSSPIQAERTLVLGSTVVGCHPVEFMEHIKGKNLKVIHNVQRWILLSQYHIYIAPGSPFTYYTSSRGEPLLGIHVDIETKQLRSDTPQHFYIRFPREFSLREESTVRSKGSTKPKTTKLDTMYVMGPTIVMVKPEDFIDLTAGQDTPILFAKLQKPRRHQDRHIYIAPGSHITYLTNSRVDLADIPYTHIVTKRLFIPWFRTGTFDKTYRTT